MPCLTKCNEGEGILVLDLMSGPKWRLTCNKCSAFLLLFEGAWKLKVLETNCSNCDAHNIFVEYKVINSFFFYNKIHLFRKVNLNYRIRS